MRAYFSSVAVAALLAMSLVATPALAQKRGDQNAARNEMQAGKILKLRDIERRVLPSMKGAEYLGPAYDSEARAYRLKFIRKGRVMYVDVDARTGKILRRSG